MNHFAGLDVSVKETSICIVDDTGRIVREVKVPGIVKCFTSLPCCPSITCRIRLAEPIGQRLSAWIANATFTAPSRAGTST